MHAKITCFTVCVLICNWLECSVAETDVLGSLYKPVCFAEIQIKDAYEKIAQCKSELNAAKCIRRNKQGNFQLYVVLMYY